MSMFTTAILDLAIQLRFCQLRLTLLYYVATTTGCDEIKLLFSALQVLKRVDLLKKRVDEDSYHGHPLLSQQHASIVKHMKYTQNNC